MVSTGGEGVKTKEKNDDTMTVFRIKRYILVFFSMLSNVYPLIVAIKLSSTRTL